MKTKLILLCILSIFLSCKGQVKRQNNTGKQKKDMEMTTEKFDIATFEGNKVNGEYNFTLEDGSQVRQTGGKTGYTEYITPPKPKLFMTFKGYYKNGTLRRYVIRFPNNFIKLRKEYNKEGELIESINYDTPFKFSFEEVLNLLKKGKDSIDIFDKNTSITRGVINEGAIWEVEWKKTDGRREELSINGITGEILNRGFHKHEDN